MGRKHLAPVALSAVPVPAYAAPSKRDGKFSLRPSMMHAAVAPAAKGRLEVLGDPAHTVKICEECANGGYRRDHQDGQG